MSLFLVSALRWRPKLFAGATEGPPPLVQPAAPEAGGGQVVGGDRGPDDATNARLNADIVTVAG